MAYKVVLTRSAEEELTQAARYIAQFSPPTAVKLVQQIQETLPTLSSMPLRAARISESGPFQHDYRQLLVKPYRLVFYVDEAAQTVFLVRIYHMARPPLTDSDV